MPDDLDLDYPSTWHQMIERRYSSPYFLGKTARDKLAEVEDFTDAACEKSRLENTKILFSVGDMPDIAVAVLGGIRYADTRELAVQYIAFMPEAFERGDVDILKFTAAHELGHMILDERHEGPRPKSANMDILKRVIAAQHISLFREGARQYRRDAALSKRFEHACDCLAVTMFSTIEEGLRALEKAMPFYAELVAERTPDKTWVPTCYRTHPSPAARVRLARRAFGY